MSTPSATLDSTTAHESEALWRRIGTWVLLVLFCIGTVASVVTVWARIQVLETDAWVETVTPLAADPAIQQAIADRITFLLNEQITGDRVTRTELGEALFGAGMAFVLDYVHRTVLEFVESPEFQEYWIAANEAAHRRLIDELTGEDAGAIFLENGQVVLDLNPAIAKVEDRLRAAGLEVVDRIQIDPARATFVLYESDAVRKAEDGLEMLETLAIVLPIVTLAALVGCLLLAYRRLRMLIWVGLGMATALALTVVALSEVRDRYLEGLPADRSADAFAAAFDIILRDLKQAVKVLAIAGVVVAGFAALASSSLVREPRLVTFVARYRNAFIGATVGVVCITLVAVDQVSLEMAIGIGLLALAAVLAVIWLARLPVTAPAQLEV